MEGGGDKAPKLGLALSGGGFRAAFFHVGVLARLAELGVLRRVEVISCVSGGSILGTLYYLHLKRLLEERSDEELAADGEEALDLRYCELVAAVERDLRAAVRKNPRARVTANLWKNLKMASPRYSRSDRIGDLYDRLLYKTAWGAKRERRKILGMSIGPEKPIELRELRIRPKDAAENFRPDRDNAGRTAKVPILLINATTLNSGHNWRFEAVRMGESDEVPHLLATNLVDKNMVLRQVYFDPDYAGPGKWLAPEKKRAFPLAKAVAASAAVPGIFTPLPINFLYEGIRVELSDGGVQDNQGIGGLQDVRADRLIVSDASRQMADLDKPAEAAPFVAGRATSIGSDRVREEQVEAIDPSGPNAMVDLCRGKIVSVPPVEGAGEKGDAPPRTVPTRVPHNVQDDLARVRTDLDFFSTIEASALELDGYRLMNEEMSLKGGSFSSVRSDCPVSAAWRFDEVAPLFDSDPPHPTLITELGAARSKFFRPLKVQGAALVASIVILLAFACAVLLVETAVGDWIADAAEWLWQPWVRIAAVSAAVLTLGIYLGSGSQSETAQKVCGAISGFILPVLLALPAFLWAWAQILAKPLRLIGEWRAAPKRPN